MKRTTYLIVVLLSIATLLTACGGGSGGGTPTTDPTKAIVKLSTLGAGSQLGGVDVTVALPAGVTVKAAAAPPETDPGVAVASGQAAANSVVTATAGTGTVRVGLANGNTNGFGTGEFATITCDLATGTEPAAADFTVQSAVVWDINGVTLSGATVTVGVTLE